MLRHKHVYLFLSFSISIILIWVLIRQINLKDLIQVLSLLYFPAFLAYVACSLLGAGLRAWRYKILLLPLRISWGNILLVTFIRNLFVDLLPARIGSLSYIYVLNKRLNYSFESATSTFLFSFVFDFLTLSPFLASSIFAVGSGASMISTKPLLIFTLIFFLLIFILFWKISEFILVSTRIYESLLRILKTRNKEWASKSLDKLKLTVEEIKHIQQRKIYWRVFGLSLLIRLSKYCSLLLLLYALLRSQGYSLQRLSLWKTILGTTGAELTSILPVKGLAGFGTWESAWSLTYKLLGFEARIAIISGIGVHLITNLFEYSLGTMSIILLAITALRMKRGKK